MLVMGLRPGIATIAVEHVVHIHDKQTALKADGINLVAAESGNVE
jgi:hypothetical protein